MSEQTFVVGDRVLVYPDWGNRAYTGTVKLVDAEGWFDVEYDEGQIDAVKPWDSYPPEALYAVPADPPPAQPDDERVQAIRERLAKVPDEELFVKGNYTYWLVRGK